MRNQTKVNLIMAALLMEGAIGDALTLNFDLAARSALSHLGARENVSVVRGPEEHGQLGVRNLIFLHRDIESPHDELILRKSKLEEAWQDQWEQVVAHRVLSGPTTVFVGLGTPSAVLVATMNHILEALDKSQATVYVADVLPHEDSCFAGKLNVDSNCYIQLGWSDLMRELAKRVVQEHCAVVEDDCTGLSKKVGIPSEDVSDICRKLAELGILGLGQLRAKWMLTTGSYLAHRQDHSIHLLSDLILGVRLLERVSGLQARFHRDGLVEFSNESSTTRTIVCSGGGWMSYQLVSAKLDKQREALQREGRAPSVAFVAGVRYNQEITPPHDIVEEADPNELVSGAATLTVVNIDDLRGNPQKVQEVFRWK